VQVIEEEFLDVKQASNYASELLGKHVTTSNINYLIQYGRVKKYVERGNTLVSKIELLSYYNSYNGNRESIWKDQLGSDLNWALSFDQFKEAETTKHVHRLHPYKGKFIPQLVEYFIDQHTDEFKKEVFFKPGDIILDPFSGSGTTMVQASELGIHAIGIDISEFNAMIANSKVGKYNLYTLNHEINRISVHLQDYIRDSHVVDFEEELLKKLNEFNNQYFPVPDFKYKVRNKQINEKAYGLEKENDFIYIYNDLVSKYNIKLRQDHNEKFIDKWFIQNVRDEIDFVNHQIDKIEDENIRRIVRVILSRTVRSCRATTHADLATIYDPVISTYYCSKHGKICKPLFSILKWWESYSKDTLKRLYQFDGLRTKTYQYCLTGDSRTIDLFSSLKLINPDFYDIVKGKKIKGIFSSPPYVGLIDYHEQHAYAYDLFGFKRQDELEIGPLFKGQGREAKESYLKGISDVLNNALKYLTDDCDVFLVANDKYNLYPTIAEKSGMKIVNQYKRPVLNRTEKDKGAYSEIIFHLKRK